MWTFSSRHILSASAFLRSLSLAFSNWPNSFSTARWSAFSRATASGPRPAVELAVLLRAPADFLAVECVAVGIGRLPD